nr:MAG TPA: hypothetical protein [Bacteriophage sp.]DAO29655.1 MAG TPA: hypothetical protein [Bacteriophage sp.]
MRTFIYSSNIFLDKLLYLINKFFNILMNFSY